MHEVFQFVFNFCAFKAVQTHFVPCVSFYYKVREEQRKLYLFFFWSLLPIMHLSFKSTVHISAVSTLSSRARTSHSTFLPMHLPCKGIQSLYSRQKCSNQCFIRTVHVENPKLTCSRQQNIKIQAKWRMFLIQSPVIADDCIAQSYCKHFFSVLDIMK